MLDRLDAACFGESGDSVHGLFAIRLRNKLDELPSDQLFPLSFEEPAVRLVDEGQRRVRPKTANEIGLCLDHFAVSFFAGSQCFLGFPSFFKGRRQTQLSNTNEEQKDLQRTSVFEGGMRGKWSRTVCSSPNRDDRYYQERSAGPCNPEAHSGPQ